MKTNKTHPLPAYQPDPDRYDSEFYRPCGSSGIRLPSLTMGLWHNFGDHADPEEARAMLRCAFDLGITHFDLANNYGPPPGSAEQNFGKIFDLDFRPHRDELFIATKAGFDMWSGPYGRGGSKKHLISSLDQSLQRMGLEYVDVFYHHVPDKDTPLEETAEALAQVVQQGKALYVGISNYGNPEQLTSMVQALNDRGVPLLLNQLRYNPMDRRAESIFDLAETSGFGIIAFSPLEQGILTGKYRNGIPEGSRATDSRSFLKNGPDPEKVAKAARLEDLAGELDCTLIELVFAWILRKEVVCSLLAGASTVAQIEENVRAIGKHTLTGEEARKVEAVVKKAEEE